MKITIGQFFAIILVLVAAYFVYTKWLVNQNNEDWVNKWNKNVYDNEGEIDTAMPGEEEQVTEQPRENGWIK